MPTLSPDAGQDWTREELTEISRLKEACRTVDYYRLECSQTDEGDPWCSVCDDRDHTVTVHISRINRRYLVAFQPVDEPMWTTNLTMAVDYVLRQIFGENGARGHRSKAGRGGEHRGERVADE